MSGLAMKAAARRGDAFGRICFDRDVHIDPYPYYDQIRRTAPIVPGAFAMVTARHDVVSYLTKQAGFCSGFPDEALPRPLRAAMAWAQDPAVFSAVDRPSMIVNNGEQHDRHRRLVSKAFTARAVDGLTARVSQIATELLDAMERDQQAAGGVTDILDRYAAVLPVLVIADIMGVPPGKKDEFLDWARAMAPIGEIGLSYPVYRRAESGAAALNSWLLEHFQHLRREPSEALLSRIIAAGAADLAAGGQGLSDSELCSIANLTLLAGFETTVHLISNGVVQLLAHPDQLGGLRDDPTGWPNAVEEILRFEPPLQNTARYPAADTEVFGVAIPAGKLIAILFGGANRDPAVFTDPNVFDVRRGNARDHLSFSHGAHFCVGAALARLEGEIGLRLLFDRFPNLAAAAPPTRRSARNLRGYATIPIQLGAPSRAAAGSVTRRAAAPGEREPSQPEAVVP
jgi:hypothetical protein